MSVGSAGMCLHPRPLPTVGAGGVVVAGQKERLRPVRDMRLHWKPAVTAVRLGCHKAAKWQLAIENAHLSPRSTFALGVCRRLNSLDVALHELGEQLLSARMSQPTATAALRKLSALSKDSQAAHAPSQGNPLIKTAPGKGSKACPA